MISESLRSAIERQIAEDAQATELGAWPLRHFAEQKLLFLTGDDAFFWYLGLDGTVYYCDHDTFAMRMEPETDAERARAAIARRANTFPALAELLGG